MRHDCLPQNGDEILLVQGRCGFLNRVNIRDDLDGNREDNVSTLADRYPIGTFAVLSTHFFRVDYILAFARGNEFLDAFKHTISSHTLGDLVVPDCQLVQVFVLKLLLQVRHAAMLQWKEIEQISSSSFPQRGDELVKTFASSTSRGRSHVGLAVRGQKDQSGAILDQMFSLRIGQNGRDGKAGTYGVC